MKLLAIIVSYNFELWMERCLGSLKQSEHPIDVMVLDNNSADNTVRLIREKHPEVMLVENRANLGFGRANNIGMHYALEHNYDGVLLLNQDAWIDADVLGRLVEASTAHPDYGILSPIHLTGNRSTVEHGFSCYSGVTDLSAQPDAGVVSVPFIDAAIWFMPIAALRKVGLFAPLFYHYGEDKDLCNRLRYHKLKIGFLPHAYGCHDREFRQATKAATMRAERVYMLSEFANICYSLPRAFAMSVLASCKKVVQALCSAKGKDGLTCTEHLTIVWELLRRSKEVIRTRKESKIVNLKNYQP